MVSESDSDTSGSTIMLPRSNLPSPPILNDSLPLKRQNAFRSPMSGKQLSAASSSLESSQQDSGHNTSSSISEGNIYYYGCLVDFHKT